MSDPNPPILARLEGLRRQLYNWPTTRLQWTRLLASERDPIARQYIVTHSPYESATYIEAAHEAWLEGICAEVDLEIGDRTFQVYQLTVRGLLVLEIVRVLGISRTRVRECLANARRRPRLARSLDALER